MRYSAGENHILDPLKEADAIEIVEMFGEIPTLSIVLCRG